MRRSIGVPTVPARLASLLAIGVLALAACNEPAALVAPTPTRPPDPTPATTVYELNTDVWYQGLVLHVDRATALLDVRGGTVDIAFRVENPGAEDADLDARMLLVVGGQRIEPTRDSHIAGTKAGETSLALLSFELQEIASADDGVLEIGSEPAHVARVPFRPENGEAVTFQPIELEVKGTNAAGDLRLTLRDAVVRWDLPDWYEELPADTRIVTVTYDATYNGSFSGGFAFTGDNVALLLPDKTMVEARRDGHSQAIELIGAGKTKRGLTSRFEIPADATGEFRLVVRNGSTEKGIKFTIEG